MRGWRSFLAGWLAAASTAALAGAALTGLRVYRAMHPVASDDADARELLEVVADFEPVRFPASDGLMLEGWWFPAPGAAPAIVVCHGAGKSKASVVDLALRLHREGFAVLAFDFRAHGSSEGTVSTLGYAEKRDVVGAVDFVAQCCGGRHARRLGGYGVGMGAHALVLAALDRPVLRVLVLDELYPEARWALAREVYGNGWLGRRLGFVPMAFYNFFHRTGPGEQPASEAVPQLLGRDLLFLAPASDAALVNDLRRIYQTVPEQREVDGNLVLFPGPTTASLHGEDRRDYEARIVGFFRSRLAGRP